jgi:hypothetical protein
MARAQQLTSRLFSQMDAQISTIVKSLTIKDLRIQLRVRGASPAGGQASEKLTAIAWLFLLITLQTQQETLANRLRELMASTGDLSIKGDDGE